MIKIPNNVFFREVERLLAEGESVEMNIKGTSMYPYLREGKDKVVVSPVLPGDLQPGAIILFRYVNQYILHRIALCKRSYFVMKGDGTFHNWEEAYPANIVGIVRTVIRPNGRLASTESVHVRLYKRYWRSISRPLRKYLIAALRRINY
jgi:hypothetical protein